MGLLVGVLGCAGGAETSPVTTFGPAPSDDDDSPMTTTGAAESSEGTTSIGDPGGSTSTGSADESTTGLLDDGGSSSSDGGGGDESTTTDTGEEPCLNETMCSTARAVGGVSGDTGADVLAETGAEPVWLTFQVSEDDSDVAGVAMSFRATLVSPPGADFDLYVYRGTEGGTTGCGGFVQASVTTGVDSVYMTWGEGLIANGVEDDVWVAVEIVPKDAECAAPEQWSLEVEGNV